MLNIDEQIKIITKGTEEIIDEQGLRKKIEKAIKENKPLNVKLGLDPSAPDIHIGHAVVLRKIKQLQDLGHRAIIIIGDFTGMIGDPTGKSKTRKQLTMEEVLINAETYKSQIFKILDKETTTVCFNSEWLNKLSFREIIEIVSHHTVARILERDDFKQRFNNNLPVGIHELFYPLMQGYDSVHLEADIEVGGTEQRFNILMGRTMQSQRNMEQQIAIFMPILEGTDGVEKMSKSLNNYIGINELPNDIFGKVMSISDDLIIKYYSLGTDLHPSEIAEFKRKMNCNEVNPRDIKMHLAEEITRLYHGEAKAKDARQFFVELFQKKNVPQNISELKISEYDNIISIIIKSGKVNSKSEARRLIFI